MHKFNIIENDDSCSAQVAADSIEDLFIGSIYAWRDAEIEKFRFSGTDYKHINLVSPDYELMLMELLENINEMFNSESWLFERISKLSISKKNSLYNLDCILLGSEVNMHNLIVNFKIEDISYEQFEIFEESNVYSTYLVFEYE